MSESKRPKILILILFFSISLVTIPTLSFAQVDIDEMDELYNSLYLDGQTAEGEVPSESLIMDLYIDEAGSVLLTGYVEPKCLSNFSFLETSEYLFDEETKEFYAVTNSLTSKQADDWTINFSACGYYTECNVVMNLPETAKLRSVSYSEGFGHFVYSSNESIIVEIQGFNIEDPSIVLEYQQNLNGNDYAGDIIPSESKIGSTEILIIASLVFIVLIFLIIVIILIKKPTPKKINTDEENDTLKVTSEMNKVMETLSERERSIVEALIKNDGRLTQADIRFETQIPKSSLSGIIHALEKRKIITKKKRGRTNIIELSDWFLSEEKKR